MTTTYSFDIDKPAELAAGLNGYTDTVTVLVGSGDPGGELGEFEAYMRDCLAEWFDGARVTLNDGARKAAMDALFS